MSQKSYLRRPACILAADLVSYSDLMRQDETGTLRAFDAAMTGIVGPRIAEAGGRIFKRMGDGLLAEFPSTQDAVGAAVAIQTGMHADAALRRAGLEFRIGLNWGDVVVEGDDLLGDAVNMAARLEACADPGGICLSAAAHQHIAGQDAAFEDIGPRRLKNMGDPVPVWRWTGAPRTPAAGKSWRR